ncbi:ribonuclease E activity regulator RraA [Pseudoduganella albidiflava]|uniref:4-hydroxy-4-methyl-2-oxoglutarate aldolase n=1 Tax=Pseudoduganella albidiflava TaxID=321983 RepID=A0A411WVG0_9BURK|nr:ribonuclease E activity regulator RraA [Pseudoduganella albidiflava]QBI00734.1 RraA family protein [Pseudoduganella albidiflava]GGY31058.1 putative 4-hydroxy-4-methyl-2-oxoglutarate aldolase [Pseudoduganella albidiflava]
MSHATPSIAPFVTDFATADLCDDNAMLLEDGRLAVLPPVLRHFGKRTRFAGRVVTLKVFEDNALVRAMLETPGDGQVLVVDGGGSLRRALVGGQLALLAQDNGWAGVVVDGCVRDSMEIDSCDIGIRALATHPQRGAKKGAGERNVRVQIAGVPVNPGDWLYADADGILVAQQRLA